MSNPVDALILDLLEWLEPQPRSYIDVIEAWRTSCPRLTVWEDAQERGLIERQPHEQLGSIISLTARGQALLITAARLSVNVGPTSVSSVATEHDQPREAPKGALVQFQARWYE